MPRKPTSTCTMKVMKFYGWTGKKTFNKLNQMSTKPSASASTVGVAVNGFLLLSNNSAYHLCSTQADLYK